MTIMFSFDVVRSLWVDCINTCLLPLKLGLFIAKLKFTSYNMYCNFWKLKRPA